MSGPIGASPWMYGITPPFYDYKIDQSLRFNDADAAYLSRTYSTAQTNTKKITVSVWVKRGILGKTRDTIIFSRNGGAGRIGFDSDTLFANAFDTGYNGFTSSAVFRDTSAWYHIVYQGDSTLATAADRNICYVNGVLQVNANSSSLTPQDSVTNILKNGQVTYIGRDVDNSSYDTNSYMAELNVIDGSVVAPTDFGEFKNGVWVPKEYSGSYGTNGFYLKFASGAVGTDSSGNGHTFTHTAGNASRNRPVQDSPTNNFNVIPFTNTSLLTHEHQGMRVNTARTGYWDGVAGSFSVKSGKWYYEVQLNVGSSDNFRCVPGWKQEPEESTKVFNRLGSSGDPFGTGSGDLGNTGHYAYQSWNTQYYGNGGYTGTSIAASSGDVINVAVDFDDNKIYFGKNGTYIANDGGTDGDPANGTNESLSGLYSTGKFYSPCISLRSDGTSGSNSARFNFGSDRSFGANLALGTAYADENGYGEFRYAVPSGFLALCSQNLPEIVIGPNSDTQADDYFNTVLYTGNGGTNAITGVGFQPDWVWLKKRSAAGIHNLFDSSRGTKLLQPQSDDGQQDNANYLTAYGADGFTVGSSSNVNASSETFVAWNWKAGGTPTADNVAAANAEPTAGSAKIDGSNQSGAFSGSPSIAIKKLSANTTAGVSIVRWTGTGSAGTIPHGLGAVPHFYTVKNLTDDGTSWQSYHRGIASDAETDYIYLNSSAAADDSDDWNDTAPTANVFSVKTHNQVNASGDEYIAYLFTSVEGYSKFGHYTGNFNADGPFIRTGFRPAWIMLKRTDSADSWLMRDNKRDTFNVTTQIIITNSTAAEYTDSTLIDFYSTGFKLKHQNSLMNASGGNFIYFAFAEQPFKYANAR